MTPVEPAIGSAYMAAKAGARHLMHMLALELAADGILVNAIAPGLFETEMTTEYPEGYLESAAQSRIVLGRMGDPAELAATLVWLASAAAGYVTGQTIVVDGGFTIT